MSLGKWREAEVAGRPHLLLGVGQDHSPLHRLHQQRALLPRVQRVHTPAANRARRPVAQPQARLVHQPEPPHRCTSVQLSACQADPTLHA